MSYSASERSTHGTCTHDAHFLPIENIDEPAIQQTMKVEKITPNGKPSKLSPISSFASAVRAGVHMNTKMYMDPSNNDEMIPHDNMSGERMVAAKAPFNAPVADDLSPLLLSSSSSLFSP